MMAPDLETTAVFNARRQRLRDRIFEYGPEHFDMENWFRVNYEDENADEYYDTPSLQDAFNINIDSCGTTGCLAGHGMLDLVLNDPEALAGYLSGIEDDNDLENRLSGVSGRNIEFVLVQYYDFPRDDTGINTPWFYHERWPDWAKVRFGNLWASGMGNSSAEWMTVIWMLDNLIAGTENDFGIRLVKVPVAEPASSK